MHVIEQLNIHSSNSTTQCDVQHVIEATFPRAREFDRKSELEKAYERCGEHRSIIINPFHKDTRSAGGQHFWHIFCHINM